MKNTALLIAGWMALDTIGNARIMTVNADVMRITIILSAMLLMGCERDGQAPRSTWFPTPCITCADGSVYCSDLRKPSC